MSALERLDAEIRGLEAEIALKARENDVARRLTTMRGVTPLIATAVVALAPPPQTFRRGRDFAAWLGLTPRQHSTGGKQRHSLSQLPGSAAPLDRLQGLKAEGEGEWHARRHGRPKRRVGRKIHLRIDERTLEVRAIEVTTSDAGDAPMLPELLDQRPRGQEIGSVTADGAYDTRRCHDAAAHAVIPPRENAKR